MKKYHLLTAFSAGILLVILVGVPYFVERDLTRQTVVQKVEETYNLKLKTDSLHWNWLPVPHLTIYGSQANYKQKVYCNIPKLKIYPDWLRMLLGKVQPKRLELKRPHFTFKENLLKKGITDTLAPPFFPDIYMADFSLSLDSAKTDIIPSLSLDLKKGDFELKKLAGRHYLSVNSETSFSEELVLKGWYNPLSSNYSASASIGKFHLQDLTSNSDYFSPLPSEVDMTWTCDGVWGDKFEGSFRGNLPSFTLRRKGEKTDSKKRTNLRFSKADFDLVQNKEGLLLTFHNLSLDQPGLTLAGIAARLKREKPVYKLDLKGSNVNLDEVRQSLLGILVDHKITRKVCEIVQGGTVAQASYQFEGPIEDFKKFKKMTISAEVNSSEIHIPGIDLNLDNTGGNILIEDGKLQGTGLRACLGNSLGRDATLALGLTSDNKLFNLEIDLDADISELPGILHHLIKKKNFQREVEKFKGSGRVKAHLSMGDSRAAFRTNIEIEDGSAAEIYYERYPWPIYFYEGFVEIFNKQVEVIDCSLESGPHLLSEFSGALSWQKKDILFDINQLNADVDSADLLKYLFQYPKLASFITPHLKTIGGRINITDSKISGPIFNPGKWNYAVNLDVEKDAEIVTPYLKETLKIKDGKTLLRNNQIAFDDLNLVFRNSPLLIRKGQLTHESFMNWQCSLALSGKISPEFIEWFRKYKGLSPSYMPAAPFKLNDLRIDRKLDSLAVRGDISKITAKENDIALKVIFERDDSDIKKLQVNCLTPTDSAFFDFRKSPDDRIYLNWKGNLDGEIPRKIFNKPPLLFEKLQGNFQTTFFPETGKFASEGHLNIGNFSYARYLPEITVQKLNIRGEGPLIKVENLVVNHHDQRADIKGKINTQGRPVQINLNLSSDFLSQDNVVEFVKKTIIFREKMLNFLTSEKEEVLPVTDLQLKCDRFNLTRLKEKNSKTTSLTLTPLQGRFYSKKDQLILNLENSSLCGLKLNGFLTYQDGGFQIDEIEGTAPAGKILHFEKILPCLGLEAGIIKGPFTTNFSLSKEDDIYNKGRLAINSQEGRILRWGLLAKIFQVVNITEMGDILRGRGFEYDKLTGEAHISRNKLIIDKAELKGQGLDLLARGNIDLKEMSMDVTVYLVPFKTIDAILNMIPLVGRLIQGKEGHIITIPVGLKGPVNDPNVTALPPKAVGKGAINFILDTISFPFDIIPGQDEKKN